MHASCMAHYSRDTDSRLAAMTTLPTAGALYASGTNPVARPPVGTATVQNLSPSEAERM